MCCTSQGNGTHCFSLSTSYQNYSFILNLSLCRPSFFFCFLFSIFSNYLGLLLFLVHDLICKTQVNILKIFQTALCFISKNQLHIAQAVAESTSPWQNYNSAGNVKESCLQPDQSNHIFPPLQDSAICYRAL